MIVSNIRPQQIQEQSTVKCVRNSYIEVETDQLQLLPTTQMKLNYLYVIYSWNHIILSNPWACHQLRHPMGVHRWTTAPTNALPRPHHLPVHISIRHTQERHNGTMSCHTHVH